MNLGKLILKPDGVLFMCLLNNKTRWMLRRAQPSLSVEISN
jgi:hypothetical protein